MSIIILFEFKVMKKIIITIFSSLVAIVGGFAGMPPKIDSPTPDTPTWSDICDGTNITENCTAEDGLRYETYIYHEPTPEVTKKIFHPAEPAKTHIEHHAAVYGTRTVNVGCVKTTISNKYGSCALSQCWDGEYSGSTGRGTCSYHGGVMRRDGPWYIYEEQTYVVTPAWDETVVDVPAKDAWTEIVVVSSAKEAYIEKKLAEN